MYILKRCLLLILYLYFILSYVFKQLDTLLCVQQRGSGIRAQDHLLRVNHANLITVELYRCHLKGSMPKTRSRLKSVFAKDPQ